MATDLLKPRDVADRLGVSTSRVYQLIAAAEIPSIRIGNAIKIPRAAWDCWMAEKAEEAAARTSAK